MPAWDQIRTNYDGLTTGNLDRLYEAIEPVGGKLFVWHGVPGTGKTFALRALAWEWRAWADLHYLIDPETFFGSAPGDLMQVVLEGEDMPLKVGESAPPDRWKLLVLEDTGEMLTPDARTQVGQGLSRLLNLVDGLIGQGLHLMVLVTTNEELGQLHPAVTRPGRCAGDIKFGALSRDEANHWLTREGVRTAVTSEKTLAELFAMANDWGSRKEERRVGFAHAN